MTKQSLTFMKVMRLLRFARNDGEIFAIHGQAAERETSFQLVPMLGRGILKLQKNTVSGYIRYEGLDEGCQ